MSVWTAVIVTCVGCYVLKLTGLAAPRRLLERPWVRRFAESAPVALLSALIVVQTFASGRSLDLDPAKAAGMAAAIVALLLRAPFLVVLVTAAAVTALTRLAGL
jgi:branched-subunit amino acid transport protein